MQSRKVIRRNGVRQRIRKVIKGTTESPRLSVFRSNKQIYAQIIDDSNGHTLASASSRETSTKSNKTELASLVGKSIAEKAIAAGVTKVVFDRGGYLYHGRIKALAEGARNGGLKF